MRYFLVLLMAVLLAIPTAVKSQSYSTGVGVKLGPLTGLSVKHFIYDNAAFEVIVGSRWRGVQALALYELHANAFDVAGLYWYYGGGGHIGFWNGNSNAPWGSNQSSFVGIGIDGVLGMEYDIQEIPITLSLDIVPAFNVGGHTDFWLDGGLGIRYIF